MNYTEKTKPGMGDPYWYEWSVGEQQIINMLNEDNNIEYVELQANVGLGLDDVVVTYRDGKVLCIQVKHTRADDTLTFADLVYSAKKTSKSLLAELADSWQEESRRYTEVIPQVFTNRRKGQIISTTKGKDTFVRPALDVFWKRLNEKIKSAKNFEDIVFEEYPEAWNEWKTQLSGIQSNNDKLKFLRLLQLETEQKDLQEIENEVLGHLSTAFRITLDDADKLLGKLDHALRKWTTSGRNTSRIYVEDVYAALSIDDYISPYNHELMPAEPFFDSRKDFVEEIEKELLLGNEKVLFLSGIPGTGKTNIVSKLCNKRDSIIKIRYYAYEPIQPDKEYLPIDVSERVKKEHFWNEMFSQLKQCLKGSLHKYNVPLQNCFMSLEEMKKHFFEIASAYARDIGCTFVIAIDGIDHAARAGIVSETFLATLPRPEYIPDNIKLLISGQPQESYPNYPLWLKRKNDSVKRLDVPGIERGDILSLVTQKISDTRSSEYNVITDIVEKYAEKNTLAAIFAVYEASQCADAMKLERKLSDRKLSGNIEEYYSNIWNDTVGTLKQYDFVDYKLAGVFAFFNERVNGQILSEIFNELNIPVAVWNDVLKTLKPLIVEEAGKYHVLHNDVKVFLSNIVKIDNEHIEEVASSLVNYYLHKKEKSQAFYFDIIRLMYMANKQEEISDIFSSKFVIEAYVNGVEILELKSIAKEIMKRLFKQEKIDYIKLQSLSTTILTINKIKYTKDEINSIELRNIKPYIGVASYECYVEPISKWDACLISEVLSYAKELYFSGEKKRSIDLFIRWFEKLNIVDIWNALQNKGILHARSSKNIMLTAEQSKIADNLGKLICWSKQYNMLKKVVKWNGEMDDFMCNLSEAFLNTAVLTYKNKELEDALDSIKHITIEFEVLIDILIELISDLNFSSIDIIERVNRSIFIKSKVGIVFDLFMRIVSGNIENYNKYEREDIYNQIKDIKLPNENFQYEIYYYIMYAIVVSYLQPALDRTVVSKQILDKYWTNNPHKDRNYYGAWFNCFCYLGRWLYAKYKSQKFTELPSEMKNILSLAVIKDWALNVSDVQIRNILSLFLKAYIILARQESEAYRLTISDVCEKIFENNPVNQVIDAGWYFYKDNIERLKNWYQDWLGEKGRAWSKPIQDRNCIIKNILNLVDKYKLENYINTLDTRKKASWSVIGYSSNRECSLSEVLEWYENLVDTGYNNISTYTKKIKSLSNKIKRLGENQFDYQANCMLYEDLCSAGLIATKEVLLTNTYMDEILKQPSYIINGMIGYLKHASITSKDLLAIWAFGLGIMNWKNESDHTMISELYSAIELCAEKNHINSLRNQMYKMGKAEIGIGEYSNLNKHNDSLNKERYGQGSCDCIEKYLQKEKLDYNDRLELLEECKAIDNNEEKYYLYLQEILKKELLGEEYEWRNRELLKYVINNLPNEIADQYISSYFLEGLNGERERFYSDENLMYLCLWKSKQCGMIYCKQSLDNLLDTHNLWVSSAERIDIQEENINEDIDRNLHRIYSYLEIKNINSFESLYIRILMLFMMSDNSDEVETSLRGIYYLLQIYPDLIDEVEKFWDKFHYRAKEWILMVYELLTETKVINKALFEELAMKHINDSDFNAAFYSRILLQRLCGKDSFEMLKKKQKYFNKIPEYGTKNILFIASTEQYLTCTRYVMKLLNRMTEELDGDCSDIEGKVAGYSDLINDTEHMLFDVGGEKQNKVILENINIAFFRVLYKKWYQGRWKGEETQLSRIILSASEPYILLQSPELWPYQENKILNIRVNEFEKMSEDDKEKMLKKILTMGISNDEIVLGGALTEYSYKKEMEGYMITYIDSPAIKKNFIASAYERNIRLLIHRSEKFIEKEKYSLLIKNIGIESFKNSNIMCILSKYALNYFGWKIVFNDGLKIVDSNKKIIGRFEYFYGLRTDMQNKIYMNQPVIQRWVITNEAFTEIQNMLTYDLKQVAKVEVFNN